MVIYTHQTCFPWSQLSGTWEHPNGIMPNTLLALKHEVCTSHKINPMVHITLLKEKFRISSTSWFDEVKVVTMCVPPMGNQLFGLSPNSIETKRPI